MKRFGVFTTEEFYQRALAVGDIVIAVLKREEIVKPKRTLQTITIRSWNAFWEKGAWVRGSGKTYTVSGSQFKNLTRGAKQITEEEFDELIH